MVAFSFHSSFEVNARANQIKTLMTGSSGADTTFVHKDRQNQQQMKVPCTSFKVARKFIFHETANILPV